MKIWHLTADAPRRPRTAGAAHLSEIVVGTWPIEPGQHVWATFEGGSGSGLSTGRVDGRWERNSGPNSYWSLVLGPFAPGDRVTYTLHGISPANETECGPFTYVAGPAVHVALLWHQHQPLYRVERGPHARGGLRLPWIRLHALRDYYSMAALVAEEPDVHVTFNLTPVLLAQLDDYLDRGLTDRHLELTLKPAGRLTASERQEVVATFFDADWHHQIFAHDRYRSLFDMQVRGAPFTTSDLRDLQMWSNLAWFNIQFREGAVELVTGETVDVRGLVEKAEGFTLSDVRTMVEQQYRILRAVVPIHRLLQDRGQIELTTTPYFHPILPLVIDTDQATIDLEGATLPGRFAHPEDADLQVARAASAHERRFGTRPKGMWPAEGAVSEASLPVFARHGVRWIASDREVLARSGRWGYDVSDPDVLFRPYRAPTAAGDLAVFFRDTELSDFLGFEGHRVTDPDAAARAFVSDLTGRAAGARRTRQDHVVAVILDGENAWGAYEADGRPFLRALYRRLAASDAIRAVTFSEYLEGNPPRGVGAHPPDTELYELYTGSWVDEAGSAPGVELGTWIGEPAENRAWELLAAARDAVGRATPGPRRDAALEALYAAEGSDWFWWFGEDQNSDNDEVFDEIFRDHLRGAYLAVGRSAPDDLEIPLVARRVVWSFTGPAAAVAPGDTLVIRTNCPGSVSWWVEGGPAQVLELRPVGGVLAGARRFETQLGPLEAERRRLHFRFQCTSASCPRDTAACRGNEQAVRVSEGR